MNFRRGCFEVAKWSNRVDIAFLSEIYPLNVSKFAYTIAHSSVQANVHLYACCNIPFYLTDWLICWLDCVNKLWWTFLHLLTRYSIVVCGVRYGLGRPSGGWDSRTPLPVVGTTNVTECVSPFTGLLFVTPRFSEPLGIILIPTVRYYQHRTIRFHRGYKETTNWASCSELNSHSFFAEFLLTFFPLEMPLSPRSVCGLVDNYRSFKDVGWAYLTLSGKMTQ